MRRYSVQPRHRIFVEVYEFLSFAKNMDRNLTSRYSQKVPDHATDAFKTASKRAIQETAEATSDLIGNKTADKFTIHHRINQKQMKKYLYPRN